MRKLNWVDFYLLNVNKSLVSHLKPVTTTDTFQGLTKTFTLKDCIQPKFLASQGAKHETQRSRTLISNWISFRRPFVWHCSS